VGDLVRLSFSLEDSLNHRLEALMNQGGYQNRSEFIRDMIRDRLVDSEWEGNEEAIATVTLVYDHTRRRLSERLTELQHDHHGAVLASTHVHLDAHLCAEMIMLKGAARDLRDLANALQQQKGVLHGSLSMSSTGQQLG
jgi:CopG family transcriptional regulator, nickel-responsive regulator